MTTSGRRLRLSGLFSLGNVLFSRAAVADWLNHHRVAICGGGLLHLSLVSHESSRFTLAEVCLLGGTRVALWTLEQVVDLTTTMLYDNTYEISYRPCLQPAALFLRGYGCYPHL